jgi:hypothetical protein
MIRGVVCGLLETASLVLVLAIVAVALLVLLQ